MQASLSSRPPPLALTDLPLSSLAGTDALGHDAPPTAVCSGPACVTEPSLLQLFHVSIRLERRCLGPGRGGGLVGSELRIVLVTEGRPQDSLVGSRFVPFGCLQSLSWSPPNHSVRTCWALGGNTDTSFSSEANHTHVFLAYACKTYARLQQPQNVWAFPFPTNNHVWRMF